MFIRGESEDCERERERKSEIKTEIKTQREREKKISEGSEGFQIGFVHGQNRSKNVVTQLIKIKREKFG